MFQLTNIVLKQNSLLVTVDQLMLMLMSVFLCVTGDINTDFVWISGPHDDQSA